MVNLEYVLEELAFKLAAQGVKPTEDNMVIEFPDGSLHSLRKLRETGRLYFYVKPEEK